MCFFRALFLLIETENLSYSMGYIQLLYFVHTYAILFHRMFERAFLVKKKLFLSLKYFRRNSFQQGLTIFDINGNHWSIFGKLVYYWHFYSLNFSYLTWHFKAHKLSNLQTHYPDENKKTSAKITGKNLWLIFNGLPRKAAL